MSSLKQELLPLVPLFCQSLLEMGTKDLDFVQLNQLIGRKTGGVSVYPLTSSVCGKVEPCSKIIVRGKAMSQRTEDLFNLNRLRGSGHSIAAARMGAKLNTAGWISEQMGGVSYLEFLKGLEYQVENDWPQISSSLEEIRKTLLSKRGV